MTSGSFQREFFSWISEYGKKTEDKEAYVDMLSELVNAVPDNLIAQLNLSLVLAEFCLENDMPEKAKDYIQKTGFITEDAWLYLGPFDNTDGIGHNTAYITENVTHINMAALYDAGKKKVSWQKLPDDDLDAFIRMGKGLNWSVAYAFTNITSPDKREVQFLFDSDDQGKLWLNGKEIFTHTKTYAAQIDKYTIPVTLKQGKNSILVKVCEQTGGWGFYLRITDTEGKPFDDLRISNPAEN